MKSISIIQCQYRNLSRKVKSNYIRVLNSIFNPQSIIVISTNIWDLKMIRTKLRFNLGKSVLFKKKNSGYSTRYIKKSRLLFPSFQKLQIYTATVLGLYDDIFIFAPIHFFSNLPISTQLLRLDPRLNQYSFASHFYCRFNNISQIKQLFLKFRSLFTLIGLDFFQSVGGNDILIFCDRKLPK